MNKFLTAASVAALLLCLSPASNVAVADTLLVKRIDKTSSSAMPRRGLLKNQVEAQYGAPLNKQAAVGKPPITRWDYPAFSVYFEYNHVIDAVAKKATETEMGVKPAQ